MKSKETKINIEVNIFGTRFSIAVPFSKQDAVRATETEMKAFLTGLRESYPTRSVAECMAMMAYHYASSYFALKARHEAETAEAEDLLRDVARLCDGAEPTEPDGGFGLFGEF